MTVGVPAELVDKAASALRQHIHVGTEVDVEPYARAVLAAVLPDVRREVAQEIADAIYAEYIGDQPDMTEYDRGEEGGLLTAARIVHALGAS